MAASDLEVFKARLDGVRATWSSWRCLCSWHGDWNWMIFRVPSSPILRICKCKPKQDIRTNFNSTLIFFPEECLTSISHLYYYSDEAGKKEMGIHLLTMITIILVPCRICDQPYCLALVSDGFPVEPCTLLPASQMAWQLWHSACTWCSASLRVFHKNKAGTRMLKSKCTSYS